MSSKKNVVVVGGGGSGARAARALSGVLDRSKHNLILISAHPFYIHYVACLRLLVTAQDALEEKAMIPYDKLFLKGNGEFKQGTVTAIEATKGSQAGGKVVLESGETVEYDVLVLATGSRWQTFLDFPHESEKARLHVEDWRKKFSSARKVVIAGGGAVGVELAGELRDLHPEKEVTLVHGDTHLLNKTYPDKYRKDLERRVRAKKITLILDDYIDDPPASATRKGTPLDADLVIRATGQRANTDFIAASLGADVITDEGRMRIKPTMQLPAYPSIFAVGDVIDFPEQKQVGKYDGHAAIVAPNVVSVLAGAEPQKVYKGMFEGIFVTLGKNGGAGFLNFLWGLRFGNWVVSTVKGKGLFIGMTRKALGAEP